MKNASELLNTLFGIVELAKVKFDKGADLGVEFTNQIDAWSKMQFKFRSRNRVHAKGKYVKQDLVTLVYTMRERIE